MKKKNIPIYAVTFGALAIAPLFCNNYYTGVMITLVLTAYLGQCWNLMSGYAGQFSFGHAAFFGIGAYTSSLLWANFNINPYLGMVAGMVVATLIGVLIGYMSFRFKIKGDYFALSTLAVAEILRVIFNNTKAFGGANGIMLPYSPDWRVFQFENKITYYYVIFLMLALVSAGLIIMKKTRFGYYLAAIKEDEEAASSLGVNVLKYKMLAIGLSAMLTSLAGTFYAQYYSYIEPTTVFSSSVSVDAIAPCIIGGAGTFIGPILGALFIVPLEEIADALFDSVIGMNMVVYGAAIVLFLIFCPRGIMGIIKKLRKDV